MHLPATLGEAVRAEFGRAFHPPFEVPFVVLVNGLLMTGAWFLLPENLFFRLHGALAFPMILASWMLSDVPATNVLGGDRVRMGAALGDPVLLRRLLVAKNLVLWLLIVPICTAIAVVVGIVDGEPVGAAFTVVFVVVVPLGSLGAAAWLGIWFPYHPIPLKQRWENRRPLGRMVVRWVTLVLLPYGYVPMLSVLVMVPTLAVWWWANGLDGSTRLSDATFGLGVLVACGVAPVAWLGGHALGLRMVARRRRVLAETLADPLYG